jgi:protein-L-isoaspartate(D-aspartate) O-methyltransferase
MTFAGRAGGGRGLGDLPGHEAAAQETMAFLLRLRARGVADVDVLRALETVPRLAFVPHRYADLALRDMALPIPCGQTMSEPFKLAKILESLDLAPNHRVLEIGTGSGYGAALLARLAGEVVSYERFRTLALEASLRLRGLSVQNAVVAWGDGLSLGDEAGYFDRVLVDGALAPDQESRLIERLAEGGILIGSVRQEAQAPVKLVRVAHQRSDFTRTTIGESRAAPLIPGLSHAL